MPSVQAVGMASFRTVRLITMMHPLGPDLRTVPVPMVLQVRSLRDADELERHPIWIAADLTPFGRKLPRSRNFKAREIRHPGETEASALIVTFAAKGEARQRKQQVMPGRPIWEDQMSFIIQPGKPGITWQGGVEPATQSYIDHLVCPDEYGPNRQLKPLTQEELDGFRERAAHVG
jgi:hypothetical protein